MEKRLTTEQVMKYLDRIGYSGKVEPEKDVLDELIYRHQCTVPFETLDSHDFRHMVNLDLDSMYEKIVINQRGGYCLDLNGLFCHLLVAMGYKARPCLSRVLMGSNDFTHPIDHRGTLVDLDGKLYFCDVGLGGPMPPKAIEVKCDEWQTLRGEEFKIEKREEGWYALCRKSHGKKELYDDAENSHVRIELMFSTITCYDTDFEYMNFFLSTQPQTRFCAHRMLNIRTENGFRMVTDNLYKEVVDGNVTAMEVSDNLDELKPLMAEKFGIDLR